MFNEIYGNYYNIMGELIKEAQAGTLNQKRVLDVVLEKGFGESVLNIPEADRRAAEVLLRPRSVPLRQKPYS